MSRPRTESPGSAPVIDGLRHWTVEDDRIDYRSDAWAVRCDGGWVLIDPLPLAAAALAGLGPVAAIALTAACHQRAAWEIRETLGVDVWAPAGAGPLERCADARLVPGGPAPGSLTVLPAIGPTNPHVAFAWLAGDGRRVLFPGDLVMERPDGSWGLVPEGHHEDREATRRSVVDLARRPWDVLCPAHGRPRVGRVGAALEAAVSPP